MRRYGSGAGEESGLGAGEDARVGVPDVDFGQKSQILGSHVYFGILLRVPPTISDPPGRRRLTGQWQEWARSSHHRMKSGRIELLQLGPTSRSVCVLCLGMLKVRER